MAEIYTITKELRESAVSLLKTFANYEKCMKALDDPKKTEFSEKDLNEILNLLGEFRLKDVYHIIDRFKVEVAPLKQADGDPAEKKEEGSAKASKEAK